MAKSKFEYVREFEVQDTWLRNCWVVVRVDGRFAEQHNFTKPNDVRALQLMNRCAQNVMDELDHICLAYGQSDEYSFVFHKKSNWYKRRASALYSMRTHRRLSHKTAEVITSLKPLHKYIPWLRGITEQMEEELTIYCFNWSYQLEGGVNTLSPLPWKDTEENKISGTLAAEKNEILFSAFNINYNNEPMMYRKGSLLIWQKVNEVGKKIKLPNEAEEKEVEVSRWRNETTLLHCDIIGDHFWEEHPDILTDNI